MSLSNWKIIYKLMFLVALLSLGIAVVAGTGIFGLKNVVGNAREIKASSQLAMTATRLNQNTLALNAADLGVHSYGTIGGMQISLFVIGDNNGGNSNNRDNVDLTGFHQESGVSGSFSDAATGLAHTFNVWTSNANAAIHVAVEQNLDVV